MANRLIVALLALLVAAPASASYLYRYGGNFGYPAAGHCDTVVDTLGGREYRYASCDIGESFYTTAPFVKDSANAWAYQVQWESDSAATDNVCWTVESAALTDGADPDAAVTENVATVPGSAGDANQGADIRNVSAWSSPAAVRNANGDVDCTGAPSSCEHAEVRLIVTRVACSVNDLAGDARARAVIADTNP